MIVQFSKGQYVIRQGILVKRKFGSVALEVMTAVVAMVILAIVEMPRLTHFM